MAAYEHWHSLVYSHTTLISASVSLLLPLLPCVSPLLRTLVIRFRAHLGTPGWSLHLNTSVKIPFPNKVIFMVSRNLMWTYLLGSHHSTHYLYRNLLIWQVFILKTNHSWAFNTAWMANVYIQHLPRKQYLLCQILWLGIPIKFWCLSSRSIRILLRKILGLHWL